MYLDITPKKHHTYDCYQNNIIAVLSDYFKIDYRPFFWSGFDFRFVVEQATNNITITGYNNYQEQILLKQCGVKINLTNEPCIQGFKQIILNELNKFNPIGLRINGSDLPWNYENRNIDYHYLLIIGIDISASLLYCCDSFLSNEIQTIDAYYVYEKTEYMLTYDVSEDYQESFSVACDIFFTCVSNNNKKKNNDLIYLINSIKSLFEKLIGTDPNNNPIIFQLSRICWSRYNFIKSMEYFGDKYNNETFDHIKNYFGSLIDTWAKLKNMFIKATIIGDTRQLDRYGKEFINKITESETLIENEIKKLN